MKLLLCMAGNKGMCILDGVYILEKRPWQCLREVKERNNDSLTTNSIPGPAHPHKIGRAPPPSRPITILLADRNSMAIPMVDSSVIRESLSSMPGQGTKITQAIRPKIKEKKNNISRNRNTYWILGLCKSHTINKKHLPIHQA